MSRIRGKDTAPERIVRSCIHRLGYRFRLHDRRLPGCPDVVLHRLNSVVQIHGCFWHRHKGCEYAYTPKTRIQFWRAKFRENVRRDRRNEESLRRSGWRILILWECETADILKLSARLHRFLAAADKVERSLKRG
jgi:DNA mismatch endonuclease (patch repair protein)